MHWSPTPSWRQDPTKCVQDACPCIMPPLCTRLPDSLPMHPAAVSGRISSGSPWGAEARTSPEPSRVLLCLPPSRIPDKPGSSLVRTEVLCFYHTRGSTHAAGELGRQCWGCWKQRLLSIIPVRVHFLVCRDSDSRIKRLSLLGITPTGIQGSFARAETDLSPGSSRESHTACSGNHEQRVFLLGWITSARFNLFKSETYSPISYSVVYKISSAASPESHEPTAAHDPRWDSGCNRKLSLEQEFSFKWTLETGSALWNIWILSNGRMWNINTSNCFLWALASFSKQGGCCCQPSLCGTARMVRKVSWSAFIIWGLNCTRFLPLAILPSHYGTICKWKLIIVPFASWVKSWVFMTALCLLLVFYSSVWLLSLWGCVISYILRVLLREI